MLQYSKQEAQLMLTKPRDAFKGQSRQGSINQSIKFIISVAHCRLDFTKKTVEKIQAQC